MTGMLPASPSRFADARRNLKGPSNDAAFTFAAPCSPVMPRSPRRRWPLILASLIVWGCRGDSALPVAPSEPVASGPRSNTANVAPTALFTVSPRWPRPGDTVTVDASYSLDRDGSVVHYEWNLGNGTTQVAGAQAKTVYASAGSYPLSVTVVDDSGSRSTRTLSLVVSPAGAPSTAVDSAQSAVAAANTSLLAAATTVVTVTTRTALGLPVPNVPVWLSGRGREWQVTQPSAFTSTLGVTTGTIGSPMTQSAQIVAIADYTLLRPVNVSIGATNLSLTRSSVRLTDPVVSAGGDSTLLEVTARDAEGNPLVAATVSVAVTGGTSTVRNEGATDANGRRVVVIEPTACGGIPLTITASVNGTPLPASVIVTAAAPTAYGVCGPALWFDADDAGTLTQTSGTLTTWRDKSGAQRHSTATAGPTVVAGGFIGRTALRFNGTSQFLPISDVASGAPYTLLVVERRRSGRSTNFVIGGTTPTAFNNLLLGYQTGTSLRFAPYTDNLDAVVPAFTSIAAEPGRVTVGRWASGARSLMSNGAVLASDASTNAVATWSGAAIGRLNIAGTISYFDGDVGEVLLFRRALTNAERSLVNASLMRKWSLGTLSLTAGNNQTAVPGAFVATAPQVRVTDDAGVPISGATVTWQVAAGGGSVGSTTSTTDASGYASVAWSLGAGVNTLVAWYSAASGVGQSVTFTGTAALSGCPTGLSSCAMSVWFDASNSASISTNAGVLTRWSDLSGRTRHAVVASGSSGPTVSALAVNGRPAIAFTALTTLQATNALDQLTTAAEIFLVARPNAAIDGNVFGERSFTSNRMLVHLPWTGGLVYWDYGTCCMGSARISAQIPNYDAAVWSFTVAPGATPQRQLRRNGIALITGAGTMTYNAPTRDLQLARNWAGVIGEFFILPRALDATERLNVERALMAKWGIGTVAISSGNSQTVAAGASPSIAPTIRFTDANAAGIAGSLVTWQVTAGGARFGASTTFSTVTDASGFATVPLTGGQALTIGSGSNQITAWLSGAAGQGQSRVFTLTGTP
jgi:hypothetical protein